MNSVSFSQKPCSFRIILLSFASLLSWSMLRMPRNRGSPLGRRPCDNRCQSPKNQLCSVSLSWVCFVQISIILKISLKNLWTRHENFLLGSFLSVSVTFVVHFIHCRWTRTTEYCLVRNIMSLAENLGPWPPDLIHFLVFHEKYHSSPQISLH